jgi:hypothetical protein
MSQSIYTCHFSVSITPEMDNHLETLAKVRARSGKPVSKAEIVRAAIRWYLDQQDDLLARAVQIAKSLEGKLAALTDEVSLMGETLEHLTAGINEQNGLTQRIANAVQAIITHLKGGR